MNFIDQPSWILSAWERFEETLIKKRKPHKIGAVGRLVTIEEDKRISSKKMFEENNGKIKISSRLEEIDKETLAYLLLLDIAGEMDFYI